MILAALLPTLLLAAYWPALGGPFLLDDLSNVPQTRTDTFSIGKLLDVATDNHSGLFGRPIPVLTFALNYLFGAEGPTWFKVTNLALHAGNTVLVYLFSRAIITHLTYRTSAGTRRGVSAGAMAFAVAAVWALHPLQVSTVMYVVQRMTLMMAGFTLISLTLYVLMRTRQIHQGKRGLLLLPPIALSALFACLSKENGALILPHIALLEAVIFRFRVHEDARRKAFVTGFAALVVLPIVLGAVFFFVRAEQLLVGYTIRDFDMLDRLRTQPAVVLLYLKMSLLPNLGDMSFYHDGFPIRRALDVRTAAEIGVVLTLAMLVPFTARRAPILSYGIGFFFVSHLLESTILPLEIAFEHRNYAGLAGLALPLIWYATRGTVCGTSRRIALFVTAGIIGSLSLQTYARSTEWSSALTINATAARARPESIRAGTTFAVVLARAGKIDHALGELDKVSESVPSDAYARLLALHVRALAGRDFETMIEPTLRMLAEGNVASEVGQLLESMHMSGTRSGGAYPLDGEQLVSLYEAALSNPAKRLSAAHQGALYARLAETQADIGQLARATAALETATGLNPRNAEIRLRLAERLAADGALTRAYSVAKSVLEAPYEPDASTVARARAILTRSNADR